MEPTERDLLIRLDEGQTHLIKRLDSIENRIEHAETSRSKIHERLDTQQEDIFIVGQVVAQHREYLKMLSDKIDFNQTEVMPALQSWNEIRTLGKWLSIGLVALGVTGAGVLLIVKSWALAAWDWFTG